MGDDSQTIEEMLDNESRVLLERDLTTGITDFKMETDPKKEIKNQSLEKTNGIGI